MRHDASSAWRKHYLRAVGSLNGCDERLVKALGRAEIAIFTRLQEIEHSPAHATDHASEKVELTKAIDGLLLIKTAVLGYPNFSQPSQAA
ncbi:MAG: hypothetical protein ABSC71_04565 [Candidatus Acidiferrales bacterium]